MIAPGIVRLRIFSGLHLGAEVVLASGESLIGSDDSCDIILLDPGLAPRHALLRITAPPAEDGRDPEVRIMPMDSAAVIQDRAVGPEGASWPASTPCRLGTTTLAWAPATLVDDPWQAVMAGLSASPGHDTHQTARQESEAPISEPPTPLSDANDFDGSDNPPAPSSQPAKRRGGKIFRAALVVLCLGSLAVSYEFRTTPADFEHGQLSEILVSNGFSALDVSRSGEITTVRGTVSTDAERLQVLRLAQSLQTPIHLDLHVRSDRSSAIAHAFAQRGLFPEVVEIADNGSVLIRGYIKDAQTEEAAFAAVLDDFQAAGKLPVTRKISHAGEVAAMLEPLLAKNELDFAQPEYLPGIVTFAGTFSEMQRTRLQEVMSDVQQRLETPVPFKVVPEKPRRLTARAEPLASEPSAGPRQRGEDRAMSPVPAPDNVRPTGIMTPTEPDTDGIKVTGVTLTPMRFITLNTGERVFEGGQLPSGHVVEDIGAKELRLRRDGVVTTYKLRGNNE